MKEYNKVIMYRLSTKQRAFIESLFKEMYPMLLRYAKANLDSKEMAEEAVQMVFLKACSAPKKLMNSANPEGWTVQALKNVLREMYRKRDRMQELVVANTKLSKTVHYDDYFDAEYGDILSPEEFALIRRLKVDCYSIREAAEELGISEEVCKKRSQRAMDKLRKKLRII